MVEIVHSIPLFLDIETVDPLEAGWVRPTIEGLDPFDWKSVRDQELEYARIENELGISMGQLGCQERFLGC